jgi:hypothetical protein
MPTSEFAVRVTGIKEMTAALGDLGPATEKIIRSNLLQQAGKIATVIKGVMPHKTGAAAGSVKVGQSKGGAWISEGSGVPYVPWLDFGGSVGRGHQRGANMGAVHREWLGKPAGSGRYLYPQIFAHQADTLKAVGDAVSEAARELGFETHG